MTEFGIVNLAGRTTWEGMETLISIANPDFREKLIPAAGPLSGKDTVYPDRFKVL